MTVVPPVISQIGYPGAGDVDDCWCVATIWAALAADPSAYQPTVPEFRKAAGNPDKPGPTGGDLDDVIRGASATWPQIRLLRYQSTEWALFEERLRDGWVASLAVQSSALPTRLQFGFRGAHQVGVMFANGEWRLMNPLAHNGAPTGWITESDLRTAARAVAHGFILAALFEPTKEDYIPLPIYTQEARPGTLTLAPKTALRAWKPAADGWVVAKTLQPRPEPWTARFDALLIRIGGHTMPSRLLRVSSGGFKGLYVSTADVAEDFD
jgi:hypothetical protein